MEAESRDGVLLTCFIWQGKEVSTKLEKIHMDNVASTCCVICREHMGEYTPGEVHHLADGSNPRSNFMVACLCPEHHRGSTGVHGAGIKKFCMMWRIPNEYYLLELQNKFLTKDANM